MYKISYWCPYISVGGVIKLIINSSNSLVRYSHNKFNLEILSFFGEWHGYKSNFSENNIKIVGFFSKNFKKYFLSNGYVLSRISFIMIFLFSLFPLYKYLRKEKPDYLIAHLITSAPIFLYNLFKFNTKLVLRISGMPKLNYFRKLFWRISERNISFIVVPTMQTFQYLIDNKIFSKHKVFIVNDPIINVAEINQLLKNEKEENKLQIKNDFFLSIGRLTKQKNHKTLIKAFNEFSKHNNSHDLVILGTGELENDLKKLTKKLNLDKKIHFMGHVNNVFKYIKKSTAVISTSLWEECSYVLIEAAYLNLIIHSDCKSGPKEFIEENKCGYLFNQNSFTDLANIMHKFLNDSKVEIYKKKLKAKIKTKEYTCYAHYKKFKKVLIQNSC